MSTVRQGLIVVVALSSVAFTGTAMAGKGGFKGSPNLAPPGQAGTSPGQAGALGSPGQVWKSDKGTGALPPGQQYNQDRSLNSLTTPAVPPGHTFGTPGNPIPGSLP